MKKLIMVLLAVFVSSLCFADEKITGLPEDTSPTYDDMILTVDNPGGGTPTNKKATIQNLPNPSATYTVASSTSVNKAGADYICDGTADEVQIQAALNALPEEGGRILLLEGTFNLEGQINFPAIHNLSIQGMGWSTILYSDTTGNEHVFSDDAITATYNEDTMRHQWHFSDFLINGNWGNKTGGHGFDFDNNKVKDIQWHRIRFEYIQDWAIWVFSNYGLMTITNCDINYSMGGGIYKDGATTILISSNWLRHAGYHSTNCDASGIFIDNGHWSIINNTIYSNYGHGIKISGGNYGKLIGNHIGQNSYNDDSSCDFYDVYIASGNYCQIIGNDIIGYDQTIDYGIYLATGANIVKNNSFRQADRYDIAPLAEFGTSMGNLVFDNPGSEMTLTADMSNAEYPVTLLDTSAADITLYLRDKDFDGVTWTFEVTDSTLSFNGGTYITVETHRYASNTDQYELRSVGDKVVFVWDNGAFVTKSINAVETISADMDTCSRFGITYLNTNAADITVTLGDGFEPGQRKTIILTDATQAGDGGTEVTVTSHKSGDNAVFTFQQLEDILILEWDNVNEVWHSILNDAV